MSHLDELNQKQREAVEAQEGPVLILAGAGAGKTKTLTHRVLNLVEKGVPPESILAITFTNKSAGEMKERITKALRESKELNFPVRNEGLPFVSTFHALGVHILKTHAQKIGLTRHFSIFDRNDSKKAVKEAMKQTGVNPKDHPPDMFLKIISKEKGDDVSLDEYKIRTEGEYMPSLIYDVWEKYNKIKKDENALDFDDLLIETVRLLDKNPDILKMYQDRWHYINIDEYQDTNTIQNKMTELLAGERKNICVVGDIDQNIYSWRGAKLRHMLDFETAFPGTKVVVLEQNYRSTKTILEVANKVIEKNIHRKEKKLFTENNKGDLVTLYSAPTASLEARFVAEKCGELIRLGAEPQDIAVLYRANFQSRILEESFLNLSLPYQVLGTRFFDRAEVKDVLAYIKSALNRDSWTDIKRIINTPTRGIGKTTVLRLIEGNTEKLTPAFQKRVGDFYKILDQIKEVAEKENPSEIIRFVLEKSGIKESLEKDGEEGLERIENIRELATLASKYDTLPAPEGIEKLLENASLATDQDSLEKKENAVKLMTVHASKGLEFPYVFITGLEQDLFPHKKLSEERISGEESEEERRLFYVALTRAQKKLFLTSACIRTIFGSEELHSPSEFLEDIDDRLIEREQEDVDYSENQDGDGLLGFPGNEKTIRF